MSDLRTAAQQALEALEGKRYTACGWRSDCDKAITALRAALAEPVQGCPSCEYNKQRAQLWRNEAYKLGGHPLDWEPELMVRPKPLSVDEIRALHKKAWPYCDMTTPDYEFARAIERAHGIGEKK